MIEVAENLNPLQATTLTIIVGTDSLGLNTFQFHGIGVSERFMDAPVGA